MSAEGLHNYSLPHLSASDVPLILPIFPPGHVFGCLCHEVGPE
jgi:hypothetical protein